MLLNQMAELPKLLVSIIIIKPLVVLFNCFVYEV